MNIINLFIYPIIIYIIIAYFIGIVNFISTLLDRPRLNLFVDYKNQNIVYDYKKRLYLWKEQSVESFFVMLISPLMGIYILIKDLS